MWAWLLRFILPGLEDAVLKEVYDFLTGIMHDRGLIQQGREQQHADDLQASVTEAKDAARTDETVTRMPDSALDDALERLRSPKPNPAPGNG